MNLQQKADKAFRQMTAGWPQEKEAFCAGADEMLSIILAEANIEKEDSDNKDGTFTTEASYRGKRFIYVGAQKIRPLLARTMS